MAYDDDFFEDEDQDLEDDDDYSAPRSGKSGRSGGRSRGGGSLLVIILLVLALALGGLNGYQFIQQRDAKQQIRELKEELALTKLELKNLQNAPTPAPAQAAPAQATPAPAAPAAAPASGFSPDFTFSTDDRNGRAWDESTFADYKLTMINFWEPWCGPCVGEMGDLQRLYETYAGQGFQILGVYSETGMEADVDSVLASTGVKYPILHYTSAFDQFQTGYVPTTIFVDQTGRLVTRDLTGDDFVIGSNSYGAWEAIVRAGLS